MSLRLLCCQMLLLTGWLGAGVLLGEHGDVQARARKPHVNVAIIGERGEGKAELAALISKVCAQTYGGEAVPLETLIRAQKLIAGSSPGERLSTAAAFLQHETRVQHYCQIVLPDQPNGLKEVAVHLAAADALIVLVGATGDIPPATRARLLVARSRGVPSAAVFVRTDEVQGEGKARRKQVQEKIRTMLRESGYDPDKTPVLEGSTSISWRNRKTAPDQIRALLGVMDAQFRGRPVQLDSPFLMPIDRVFHIPGHGTVVTGRVERGQVHVGEPVDLVGFRNTTSTQCGAIQVFRRDLQIAEAGDIVGITLSGISKSDASEGMLLAARNSVRRYGRFDASVYLFTEEQGGRQGPVLSGASCRLLIRTADIAGMISLTEPQDVVPLGERTAVTVKLEREVGMEKGDRFVLHDEGKFIGVGIVAALVRE